MASHRHHQDRTGASTSASTSHRQPGNNKQFVLLPLYIYPTPTSWEPLFAAAESHPGLDFLVVVNPANGPGPDLLPDDNYLAALGRLATLPNARIVGYVHASYGQRLTEEIVADVAAYRGWLGESRRREGCLPFHVDGIFIDEVPSSTQFVEYMTHIATTSRSILQHYEHDTIAAPADTTTAAPSRSSDGDETVEQEAQAQDQNQNEDDEEEAAAAAAAAGLDPPAPVVIYNPGVVIDPIFYQAADYVVAFENASAQWFKGAIAPHRLPRAVQQKSVVIAHSSGGPAELGRLSAQAADCGFPGQFVTTRGGYTEWCPGWGEYVRVLAGRS